jgi:hypothetical protein
MNHLKQHSCFSFFLTLLITLFLCDGRAQAASDQIRELKEFGLYAKTQKGMKRVAPNIVFDEQGIYYLEPNKPQSFPLGSVEHFVIFGNYKMEYLTLNPMKPFRMSTLGIPRMMFGKDIALTVTKKGDNLYLVKPKGLFGRGYYAFWIEDTAWDFVIE